MYAVEVVKHSLNTLYDSRTVTIYEITIKASKLKMGQKEVSDKRCRRLAAYMAYVVTEDRNFSNNICHINYRAILANQPKKQYSNRQETRN